MVGSICLSRLVGLIQSVSSPFLQFSPFFLIRMLKIENDCFFRLTKRFFASFRNFFFFFLMNDTITILHLMTIFEVCTLLLMYFLCFFLSWIFRLASLRMYLLFFPCFGDFYHLVQTYRRPEFEWKIFQILYWLIIFSVTFHVICLSFIKQWLSIEYSLLISDLSGVLFYLSEIFK